MAFFPVEAEVLLLSLLLPLRTLPDPSDLPAYNLDHTAAVEFD